jgi:hypothetical protein
MGKSKSPTHKKSKSPARKKSKSASRGLRMRALRESAETFGLERSIPGQSQGELRARVHKRQGVRRKKNSPAASTVKGLLAYAALKRSAREMGLEHIKGEKMAQLLKRVKGEKADYMLANEYESKYE